MTRLRSREFGRRMRRKRREIVGAFPGTYFEYGRRGTRVGLIEAF